MPATPHRFLCLAPSWVGDAVMALPALRLLSASGAAVDLLGRPDVTRVLADVPGARDVIPMPVRRVQRFAAARRLRARRYDAAVLFTPAWSAAALAVLSGARQRFGTGSDHRRMLLTHALPVPPRSQHLALSFAHIAAAVLEVNAASDAAAALRRIERPEALVPPELRVRDAERADAERVLAAAGLPAGSRPWVIAPGARFGPAKRYPADRFAAAAAQLQRDAPHPVVVVGAAADAYETAAVCARLPGAVDLAGRTPLGTLLAILQSAAGVLSNDSGVMHLAAALGAPVVGVFGSTNPAWTRPLGPRATFLWRGVHCSPCYAPTCRLDFACMLDLPPEALVAALRSMRARPDRLELARS